MTSIKTKIDNFISSNQETVSFVGLEKSERKILYEILDKYNMYHSKKTINNEIIVTVSRCAGNLEVEKRKQFVKDTGIPIGLIESPFWEYYVELLDKYYNVKKKYSDFNSTVESVGGIFVYQKLLNSLINDTVEKVKHNQDYINFSNTTMIPKLKNMGNFFNFENSGKIFISLDLIQANFNTVFKYNKKIFDNKPTWNDFLNSGYNFIDDLKRIRQIIIGNLSAKKVNAVVNNYTNLIYAALKKDIPLIKIVFISDDEIIIESSLKTLSNDRSNLVNVLSNNNIDVNIVRVSTFQLVKLDNFDYYFKKHLNPDTMVETNSEPKCIDRTFLAQCIKKYENRPIESNDLVFMFGGQLSSFHKPIFDV